MSSDARGRADFFRRLSHDLRSPLGVLREVVSLLGAEPTTDSRAQHAALSRLGERSIRRLSAFADRLRVLGDLEAGHEVARAPASLASIVRTGIDEAVERESSSIVVTHDPPLEPSMVDGDARLLVLLVVELVSNALRHARARVDVVVRREGDQVRLSVEDDGPGVPIELRPTLFRRFVERTARSGLGVGLSIAHDLAVAHGGRLDLEDRRDGAGGARIVASLPSRERGA